MRSGTLVWVGMCVVGCLIASTVHANEELLRRNDKYYLGGGDRVVWAPPFPDHLDRLGFWDHACFMDYKIEPVFTITLLDESLQEIVPKLIDLTWVPSHATHVFQLSEYLQLTEQRALLPTDVLVSDLRFNNTSAKSKTLHVIVWTCQQLKQPLCTSNPEQIATMNSVHSFRNRISWEKNFNDQLTAGVALGSNRFATAAIVDASDGNIPRPVWKHTPFYEKMTNDGLPDEVHFNPYRHTDGLLYMALHYIIEIKPGSQENFTVYASIQSSESSAIDAFDLAPKSTSPVEFNRQEWERFFANVPEFHCSNPFIEKYYYYRWYGLHINRVNTHGEFNLPFPCIFEGVNAGWFRHQISNSAWVHMLETRWMHTPEIAQGSLKNFVYHQRPDGSFPGAIMSGRSEQPVGFYHANWGEAIRQLHRIHPNFEFLKDIYPALEKYVAYFDTKRDQENWHLYDVINQWETGQEFSSRYRFVDPHADDGRDFRMKGIDATTYIYELQTTLAWIANELGQGDDVKKWKAAAEQTRTAMLSRMWDPFTRIFTDVDPKTGKQSTVKAAVCFYPFLTDIVRKEHLAVINDHLLNPNEFWSTYPIPTLSFDDPLANAFGEWNDKRLNCPWNGRSWLMTTSHACDALARVALTMEPALKSKAADMLKNYISMLFLDGDLERPSSYEYYNSMNGRAPYFRGTDDYMHSWIVDLIIRYVAGLQPGDGNRIIVQPLPMGLTAFTLDNAIVKGRVIKIVWETTSTDPAVNGLFVYVDGKLASKSAQLTRVEIKL
ncbi:hypothetical protein JW960_00380 [candidate division KSB1 bacterium]|nr:hypothetical protein [candidate division KSB1 bacterium]